MQSGLAPGRRVVKTHTPAEGFPVWQDVIVIAVYRHPLDDFISLRKHVENTKTPRNDHPMGWPMRRSIRAFLEGPSDINEFDRDTLATFALHYAKTARSGRVSDSRLYHYSDMIRGGRATVERLAKAAEIDADAALLDAVAEATAFDTMKAADYASVAGTGDWKSDTGFFGSASSNKWEGKLTEAEIALYHARRADLIPDARARKWLENDDG